MAKLLARTKKKKTAAQKKSIKKSAIKRKATKATGRKKLVKKVARKVTRKLVKRVTLRHGSGLVAKKKSPAMAGSVGKVVHYYDRIGVAILKLAAPLQLGELLTFRRGQREFTQPVSSMQINHEPVEKAKKGSVVGVKVVQVADNGTMAFRA